MLNNKKKLTFSADTKRNLNTFRGFEERKRERESDAVNSD